MSQNHRWLSYFFAGFLLLLALLAWIFFAPVRLGGQNEYILINGNSMEPEIQQNDLIVVRKRFSYNIGDAIAYRNPTLNVVVFHRIVDVNLDRFIVKGDNNDWVDSYNPKPSDIVGKQWIHVVNAGKFINWIRTPIIFTLLVTIIGGVALGFLLFKSKKKTNGKTHSPFPKIKRKVGEFLRPLSHPKITNSMKQPPGSSISLETRQTRSKQLTRAREFNGTVEVIFMVLGFLAILSLALGLFAFLNPVSHLITQEIPYQQEGSYSYNALAPVGVYDTQMVKSGDPIFTKLTCKLNFSFNYLLTGNDLQNLSGTHQLTAVLSDPSSGWTRMIPLETQNTFTGNGFTSQTQMDLCQMQSIAKSMENQTGMTPYNYSLAINPLVIISGQTQNAEIFDSFTTPIVFQLNALHASLVKSDLQIDPLNPTKEGTAKLEFIGPNSLTILGLQIPVSTARALSMIGIGISLIGFLVLFIIISKTSGTSKEMSLRLKYGSSMVDVESSENHLSRSAVELLNFDDLVRLADRNNKVILHETRGWLHIYQVEADQITYRFMLNDALENPDPLIRQASHISAFNLQQGINNAEFKIFYQPIISILDKKILAVEALLRWERPQNGMVAAKDFIDHAETTGLIDVLGEWVLQEASKQVKEWRKNGLPLRLVVNFSRRQIEMNPAQLIMQVLERTGMDLDDLQIEISETSLLKNPELIFSNLIELQKMGVHLSVDGYTGISSLTNMKQIPFESIKIDRSLIKRLSQPVGSEYVQAIVSAVLERGLNVVAEGVENRFQLNLLRSHYCSQAQGYLIAHPAPAAEISVLLLGR